MKTEEMFAGFTVAAGNDRFGERILLAGDSVDCKLSGRDTDGAMCIFEVTFGWPRHLHRDQDEWIYVIAGELMLEVGDKQFRAGTGESVFIPRKVAHVWAPLGGAPVKIIDVYQPAGNMEEFFRAVSSFKDMPTREDVINKTYTDDQVDALCRLFDAYGMDLLGPGLLVE